MSYMVEMACFDSNFTVKVYLKSNVFSLLATIYSIFILEGPTLTIYKIIFSSICTNLKNGPEHIKNRGSMELIHVCDLHENVNTMKIVSFTV